MTEIVRIGNYVLTTIRICDSIVIEREVNKMKILRQETLKHDNLYDSLLLYEMGGVYIVS